LSKVAFVSTISLFHPSAAMPRLARHIARPDRGTTHAHRAPWCQTIARLLQRSGDYEVTVIDRNAHALQLLAADGSAAAATRVIDTGDAAALRHALHGQDAVLNALPYHLATLAASAAREARCHYFDLTEDVAATRAIKQLACRNAAWHPASSASSRTTSRKASRRCRT
jgi:hypothetical protein